MIRHLLCTCGVSLRGNLLREAPEALAQLEATQRLPDLTWPPGDRRWGAELQSTWLLRESGVLSPTATVHLLHSDTAEGELIAQGIGDGLRRFGFQDVRLVRLGGLQKTRERHFANTGLRSLVAAVGRLLREQVGEVRLAGINATGGFKPQIAVAALMGQVLSIPVYYKHEDFDEMVSLPPLPVTFDDEVVRAHLELFQCLESAGEMVIAPGDLDDKLRSLLDEVEIDGEHLYALSAAGQLFLESYRQRHPVGQRPQQPPAAARRGGVHFGNDHHYPNGFKAWVQKIYDQSPFIREAQSMSYAGQRGIYGPRFYLDASGDVIGEYVDNTGYGARMRFLTTAETRPEHLGALEVLREGYGDRELLRFAKGDQAAMR